MIEATNSAPRPTVATISKGATAVFFRNSGIGAPPMLAASMGARSDRLSPVTQSEEISNRACSFGNSPLGSTL